MPPWPWREYLAGGEAAFSDVMNRQAALLGMKNSQFLNATGMPAEDHLSTARDLALLARRLIEDFPDHYRYYSEKTFTYGQDFTTGSPSRSVIVTSCFGSTIP